MCGSQQLLAPLEASLHVIPGNHDDRAHLAAAFGLATVGGFVQGHAHVGELSLVALRLGCRGERRRCVRRRTAGMDRPGARRARTRPRRRRVHHPPFVTGITEMDAIGLADAAAFREVISAHGHVQAVLWGTSTA